MGYIKSDIIFDLIKKRINKCEQELCDAENFLSIANREDDEQYSCIIDEANRKVGLYQGKLAAYHDIESFLEFYE